MTQTDVARPAPAFPLRLPLVFTAAFAIALIFAAFTAHVWEDYYITYRSSKNLATGHGLVFNHGDKLHTFTSPLGVLLPAVSCLLSGNSSDTAALWIFRVMSAAAFGGALALLAAMGRRFAYPLVAALLLVGALAFDVKSVDFTINGMETGFMLLFLAYTLWAIFTPGPRRYLHLGAAWAGLMWTRPDSFIYVGLIGGGVLLFNDPARTGGDRREIFWLFIKAGLIAALLYLPWLLWAWWYYGSPIPHTIVAKGARANADTLHRVLNGSWRLPWLIWKGLTPTDSAFLPAYHMFPTWPAWTTVWSRVIATLACVIWVLPKIRLETRVASLAFYGAQCYLSFVPYFAFPWYLPPTTLLAYVAIAGLLAQLAATPQSSAIWRWVARGFTALVLLGAVSLLFLAARQLKAQQAYIETGNRRVIGEWLHDHAKPGDTVFMEPLGYIGYFSGLKTYDWPGMSSREVVDAAGLLGSDWADIIMYLQPDWLVMRTLGEGDLPKIAPKWHHINYEFVKEFSRLEEVRKLDVPGRGYLEFDASFRVYRRKSPTRHDADGYEIASPIGSSIRTIGDVSVRMVHAPGYMIIPVPAGARTVEGRFGFPPEVTDEKTKSDGAGFAVWWTDGKTQVYLQDRNLLPNELPDDLELKSYKFHLPESSRSAPAHLIFATRPLGNMNFDWTCWTRPEFH